MNKGAGAVTSPHPLATDAGIAVLEAGGTAIEAVVAAGAVLAVVTPHFCGLGGDAVWLVADRQGTAQSFLAIGQGLDRPAPEGPIPLRGPGAVLTSAALVDGWRHALDHSARHWGGRARLGDLLTPAIALAEGGFPVTGSQAFWATFRTGESAGWPGFADLFLPGGRAPAEGEILRQPGLARSLHRIAGEGPRAFYEGPLAREIVEGLRAAGVAISPTDLAATRTREAAPLSLDYRGFTLLAPPPPTQGVSTLAIMGLLAHLPLGEAAPGSAEHLHLCVEAVKQAFLDRDGIADPAFAPQPVADWLSPGHLAAKAAKVDPARALPWPQPFRHGDTVFLAATDAMGNAASVLQSTYFDWGSGVVAGDTGILWQNRGAAFSADPAHPNAFAPGKLPFYTLNPGLALKDGRPALLYGTQGADGQPQTLSMLLTRLIDYAQSPAEALAGPRFLLGQTFSDSRDSLKLEADVGEATMARLAALGHELAPIPTQSRLAGQAGVIALTGEGPVAAHDPRGEGVGRIARPPAG